MKTNDAFRDFDLWVACLAISPSLVFGEVGSPIFVSEVNIMNNTDDKPTDSKATVVQGAKKRTHKTTKSARTRKRTGSAVDSPEVAKRLKNIPPMYKGIYRKAMTGKSFRAAMHAQCLECVMWQRIEVAKCTDKGCPLYNYRPYKEEDIE